MNADGLEQNAHLGRIDQAFNLARDEIGAVGRAGGERLGALDEAEAGQERNRLGGSQAAGKSAWAVRAAWPGVASGSSF